MLHKRFNWMPEPISLFRFVLYGSLFVAYFVVLAQIAKLP
jgi:hypothetical protein